MKVTHLQHVAERRTRARRNVIRRVAKEGARVVTEERTRVEEQRQRGAERRDRAERTEGPAVRTRTESTRPVMVPASDIPELRVARGVKRRMPTHTSARIGAVVVGLI